MVLLEESLVVCEGPTIVTRPLGFAETCVSARAGVDKSRRGTRFVVCLEKEFECSLLNCFIISLKYFMFINRCICLFLICSSDCWRVDRGIGGWDLDFCEEWLYRHVWNKNEMTMRSEHSF